MKNKALFLDRDGTIIEPVPYINDPGKVRLVMPIVKKMKLFRKAGYLLILITNQSGIARGFIAPAQYDAVHKEMVSLLKKEGVSLDGVFMCPAHPDSNDFRRKPNPGMILEAIAQFKLDKSESIMVGDDPKDIEAGKRAGLRSLMIKDFLSPDLRP